MKIEIDGREILGTTNCSYPCHVNVSESSDEVLTVMFMQSAAVMKEQFDLISGKPYALYCIITEIEEVK